MELLLGCGSTRDKRIFPFKKKGWTELVTCDYNDYHKPDVLWDLNKTPWPWRDDTFDEVHAYEVFEHLGQQGDYHAFFEQFTEVWRILKPGGLFCATVPALDSKWLWGDPSHTRVITAQSLTFLNQQEYRDQVGKTPMSDFRDIYKADLRLIWEHTQDYTFLFVLQAHKSS